MASNRLMLWHAYPSRAPRDTPHNLRPRRNPHRLNHGDSRDIQPSRRGTGGASLPEWGDRGDDRAAPHRDVQEGPPLAKTRQSPGLLGQIHRNICRCGAEEDSDTPRRRGDPVFLQGGGLHAEHRHD